ncbi:hypothetical protein [Streptomyces massasporeus]|uniref:hypothetical protein n=1 Tax=Streptomyces massasporeus TaxID=67324 RepID=UPI0036533504
MITIILVLLALAIFATMPDGQRFRAVALAAVVLILSSTPWLTSIRGELIGGLERVDRFVSGPR